MCVEGVPHGLLEGTYAEVVSVESVRPARLFAMVSGNGHLIRLNGREACTPSVSLSGEVVTFASSACPFAASACGGRRPRAEAAAARRLQRTREQLRRQKI